MALAVSPCSLPSKKALKVKATQMNKPLPLNVALIFPGQGAQKVGMGLEFYQSSAAARSLFDQADQICPGLTQVMFEGPEEKLTSTAFCQPAILTMSIAALKAFEAYEKYKNINVKMTAGLSLGEYSALVASGTINFTDALRLVQQRAAFMEEAARENQGAMAAVIDFDQIKLLEICQETGIQIANFNSNNQVVITGLKANIDQAVEAIKLGATQYLAKPANADEIVAAFGHQPNSTLPLDAPIATVGRLEWEHIQRVLHEHQGNISATARALDMHRRTLQRKLAKQPLTKI